MASRRKRHGWISGLRRDRALFALIGALVLVFNAFQPLAAANAGAFSGLRIICSQDHVADEGGRPSHAPGSTECPCCIGGVCPMASGPARGLPVESASFDPTPPDDARAVVFRADAAIRSPSPPRGQTPIRAPPLCA